MGHSAASNSLMGSQIALKLTRGVPESGCPWWEPQLVCVAASPLTALASHCPADQESCLLIAEGSCQCAEGHALTASCAASECCMLCNTWCSSLLSASLCWQPWHCMLLRAVPARIRPRHPCSAADCLLLRRHTQHDSCRWSSKPLRIMLWSGWAACFLPCCPPWA